MADVEKDEITFNTTMTADKRNVDACYLRHNLFPSREGGLYPAVDLHEETYSNSFPSGSTIVAIHGNLIFVQHNSDVKIYTSSSAPNGPHTLITTLASHTFHDSIEGNDDVHILCRNIGNMQILKVDFAGTATNIGTIASLASTSKIAFDGVYHFYFFKNSVGIECIYRQIKSTAPTLVFTDVGGTPVDVATFNEQIAIFFSEGVSVKILFWDKTSSTLFDKTITERNCRYLASGNVAGTLMLVKSVGNNTNRKERIGEIVVVAYDGEKFVRLNSIKSGSSQVLRFKHTIGNEVMYVALSSNYSTLNTYLYHNWVLKIQKDGSIETVFKPPAIGGAYDVTALNVQYEYLTLCMRGSSYPLLYHNADPTSGYASYVYFTNATYITNFLNEPTNRHKLDAVSVSFEKLFGNSSSQETLTISYRVSERDPFTVLRVLTAEDVSQINTRVDEAVRLDELNDDSKGLSMQFYNIVSMTDNSPLPEFNEIQFKFDSTDGFSVIKAWYSYSYISRNTRTSR